MTGALRRHQPASVWPVAQPDPLPGTAMLPGWLGRTLITLVATYSRPGDRVLLITPPARPRATPTGFAGVVAGHFGPDEFTGLAEASWTLSRLGRSVQTMTAAAPPDYPPIDAAPAAEPPGEPLAAARQSESGSGLIPADSRPSPQSDYAPAAASATSATGHGRDRGETERGFDLVITAAHPHAVQWLRESDWDRLLTPNGLVAVITYGDFTGGQLTDGIPAVLATLRSHRLRMWDHIALLSTPTPRTLTHHRDHATAASPQRAIHTLGTAASGHHLPMTRTHHDLVLLVPEQWLAASSERVTLTGAIPLRRIDTDQEGAAAKENSSDD